MKRMKWLFWILFWSLPGWVTACSPSGSSTPLAPNPVSASYLALVSQSQWLNTARPLQAADLSGRIVLIDFWTYCCINCIHVIPDLHRLEQEFGRDLTVVGVHSGKFDNERDVENIRAAVLRYGIEHPVVNDADFKIWNSFGVNSWPTLVLLNPMGEVDRVYTGEGHFQDLKEDIQRLKLEYSGRFRSEPLPIELEKGKVSPSLLGFPGKLAYAPDLNRIFVSDSSRHRILGFQPDGTVMVEIGKEGEKGNQDGNFSAARFNTPQGLIYADKKLYVADTENHLLRLIDLQLGTVSTIAGTGRQGFERTLKNTPALKTALSSPWDLAFFPDKDQLVIAMAGTHQLWSLKLGDNTLSVLAGNGRESIDDGPYPDNSLSQPSGLSVLGNQLYFVDSETSSLRVLQDGKIRTLIGTGLFDFGFKDGKQGEARLQHPLGVWAEPSGIYIADSYNHAIRRYAPANGHIETLAGKGTRGQEDGPFPSARFNEPNAVLRVGEKFFVADTNNHQIRVLDPATQTVATLALRMPSAAPSAKPADKLPNLKIREKLSLAFGKPIEWSLRLPEGWKINADAPSALRLFEVRPEGAVLLRAYAKTEVISKQISLPALQKDGRYLLQGTFYYCREGKEALCFLQSGEAELMVEAGADTSLSWSIQP